MTPDQEPPGWAWFESSSELSTEQVELCRAFARCFSSQEGQMAIDHLTKLILERRPASEIKRAAKEEGMTFLRESALQKVFRGVTTLREINKVTFVG